eukprot:6372545-Amphidinium_carterae.1
MQDQELWNSHLAGEPRRYKAQVPQNQKVPRTKMALHALGLPVSRALHVYLVLVHHATISQQAIFLSRVVFRVGDSAPQDAESPQ